MTPIQQEAEMSLKDKIEEYAWLQWPDAHRNRFHKICEQTTIKGGLFGYSLAQQEIERLKGLVDEIDKALYIGEDLEDKDVLDFYIQVAKTIKETIAEFKQQHNL